MKAVIIKKIIDNEPCVTEDVEKDWQLLISVSEEDWRTLNTGEKIRIENLKSAFQERIQK